MNESPETTQNHELPQPHSEGSQVPGGHEALSGQAESQVSQPEHSQTAFGGVPQDSSAAASGTTPVSAAGSTGSTQGFPAIADDGDIIEKEWVEKAKQIVAMTKADPRTENREINKFKADYIKKRYNKVIKVNEEPS